MHRKEAWLLLSRQVRVVKVIRCHISPHVSCTIRERCDWLFSGKRREDTESGNTTEIP